MSKTFPFTHDVEVRFRDLDSLGHVHHSLALMYIEEARAAFWREVAGRPTVEDIDYVIGEVRVRYVERIHYPGTVSVGVRMTRIGSKSIGLEYEIRSAEGALLVTAETTMVMFDFAKGESKAVSEDLRTALQPFGP